MRLLDTVGGPADLKDLTDQQLTDLAAEIRDVLVETVSRTGGHLGPNLGMVEITLAMHRVFDSPRDRLVYDTGHQTYVHKLLTGRAPKFDTLRQQGGLSGYPSQAESEHDIVENSHASTSLSYADGLAKAYRLRKEDRHVVALIGDGGLTGGMAWEALNNIAACDDLKLVMIVNDNGRSYSPTVGGLATHLTSLRTNPRYEKILDLVKKNLGRTPYVGPPMYEVLHGVKKGLKDMLAPQGMFEDLGLKYVGPVDGHDRVAMEDALRQGEGVRRAGDRARGDPEGLRVRRRRAGRGGQLPPGPPGPQAARLDRRVRRGTGRDRPPPAGRRRDHRGDAAPDRPRRVRRRSSRTGSSTSASPSSTR